MNRIATNIIAINIIATTIIAINRIATNTIAINRLADPVKGAAQEPLRPGRGRRG